MAYLNTSSGLDGLFDQIGGMLDQKAKNDETLRGLAAGGIVPPSVAPPGVLTQLQNMFGLGQPQAPAAPMPPSQGAPGPSASMPGTTAPPAPSMAYTSPMAAAPPVAAQPIAGPAPSPPVTPPTPAGPLPSFAAAGGAPGQDNVSKALSFYQSKGLSPIAASALVGGFGVESGKGLNTNATAIGDGSDGSNSVGIGQWNGARAQGLRQFAASNGLDPSDINTQLQYSWLELNGPEKGTLQALQSAQNPLQATAAALGYERPAGWTAQNPLGAKTFGSRLQNTVALASNGFNTPFNGQPIGPNPSAFTPPPSQDPGLPTMAASGMGMQLPNATPIPPTQASAPVLPNATEFSNKRPAASSPAAFAASPQAATAPAQQAIGAATAADPLVPVPGYAGQWNKAKIEAAPDGTDVPDDGELAKAQATLSGVVQVPSRGPGTAVAGNPAAPQVSAPPSAPLSPAAGQPAAALQPARPTGAQIQALIVNPETRQLGLQLWQQAVTGKSFGFLQTGDGTIVRTDPTTGQVVPVYQGSKLQSVSAGSTLYDPSKGQAVYTAPTQDKSDTARPLTAQEKADFGLPADGAFEMQGGKVMGVPGTYSSASGSRNHVVGDALVNDKGDVLYQKPLTTGNQDPDLIETLAHRVYSGDTTALTGLGRGAQGSALLASVQKRVGELAAQYKGQPLPDFAESDVLHNRADVIGDQAGARASGTLNARLDTYAKEASGAMDLAVQQSRNVPRTQWTPVNLAVQAVQRGSNDPALAALVAANNAVINTYAKAINPNGVPTVSDKTHASEVLSAAQSPEAYEATIAQLQREINIAHNAARGARAAERSGAAAQDMPITAGTGTAPGSTSVGVFDSVKNALHLGGGAQPAPSPAAAAPAVPGGRVAPDGKTYVPDPNRAGRWLRVDP